MRLFFKLYSSVRSSETYQLSAVASSQTSYIELVRQCHDALNSVLLVRRARHLASSSPSCANVQCGAAWWSS